MKRVSPAGVPPGQFLLVEVHSGYPVAVLTHPGVVTVHVVGRPVRPAAGHSVHLQLQPL